MSTYTSEPGTRLAGRYRLVDQVNAGSGWIMWKAVDETLARPVSVLTFAQGFPRVTEVVTAARAAGRLSDARLAQVFDVEDSGQGAYIVMEWVVGETLEELLANGPLDIGRACVMMIDVSRALASAHGAGLAHLCLNPKSLRWTRTSGPKVTGLGIDAALAGASLTGTATEDPALTDTQGLAALLYAAVTGYWPGSEQTTLPAAPYADDAPCTPRQVSADVPPAIDAVICRALLQRPARHEPPILTPATFADALSAVAPPMPLPEPAPPAWGPGTRSPATGQYPVAGGYAANPNDPSGWGSPDPAHRGGTAPYQHQPAAGRSRAARSLIGVVVVLVLVAIGTTAWVLSSGSHKASPAAAGHPTASGPAGTSSAAASVVLKPVSATTYDAYEPSNNEDGEKAPLAIDGKPSTFWATQWYQGNPQFGGLKKGTGLLLDMGKPVKLSEVTVLFSSSPGTSADIYVGNTATVSQAAFSTFTKVATGTGIAGTHTYTVTSTATGRYVLIWLTSLPPSIPSAAGASAGTYQGLIYEVTVRGTPTSG
ncbi:MAG TPA: serine/threonine protein kinase [Trebonia sp.]